VYEAEKLSLGQSPGFPERQRNHSDVPGAEIITVALFDGPRRKKPGWMLKVSDCVLLIELVVERNQQ
jgi:hypothetical protein